MRVTAAGLNPMDWIMTADADTAARFGLSLPAGFGTDYAGVVDQVGDGVTGFAPGDRVFGGALSRAVADFVVVDAAGGIAANEAHRTPDGVDDRTAATLAIAGRTAAAALAVVDPGPGDTVLIGGAAGGVGVFAVQLARLAGARVIGTGSATSSDFLRGLGAEPVAYGDGLADRVRALAAGRVTAAIDLHGTETVHAARELGVPDARICTIAAQVDGVTPANGANAAPGALEEVARLVAAGQLRVPIAASFPVEQIRTAVELQASRHVHGKVVIDAVLRERAGRNIISHLHSSRQQLPGRSCCRYLVSGTRWRRRRVGRRPRAARAEARGGVRQPGLAGRHHLPGARHAVRWCRLRPARRTDPVQHGRLHRQPGVDRGSTGEREPARRRVTVSRLTGALRLRSWARRGPAGAARGRPR